MTARALSRVFYATLKCMQKYKRPFHFFLLAILFTIGLIYLLVSFPPSFVVAWHGFSVPLLAIVGILFACTLFSFCTYLFNSKIQGILFAIFCFAYLFLRYIAVTNIFFLLLLFALFVVLELFFLKKK